MAGVPVHPTGFLVNRKYWLERKYEKFFNNQKKYGIYPHSYVLGELAVQADMLYMPIVFWRSSYHGCNRYSRFYRKSDKKDYWWLPDNVIRAANCLILYLYPLAGDECKEEFLCCRLREGIYRSTVGYRNTVRKKSEMERYRLNVCEVSEGEMLIILLKYKMIFTHILNKIDKGKKYNRHCFQAVWNQGIRDILSVV